MTHTAIPDDELKVFASLKNVKVVFDIGSRDDVDYLILKPGIQLHCFEPNPIFFKELHDQIGERPNIFLNNYALGDIRGNFSYHPNVEMMDEKEGDVRTETLDWYIKEHNIQRIDFLKLDTEGWDYKILSAAPETIKLCRYIQYEHWDNDAEFRSLLEDEFEFDYIGGRNTICTRKGQPKPWIPETTVEGGLENKTDKNKL